jgi:hypothetical protein
MTEETNKSKSELEKMDKRIGVMAIIGIAILLVGGGIALWSVVSLDDQMIPDDEHITDQNMSVRDIKNASYTWTSEEIDQMTKDKLETLTVGAFLVVPGATLLYAAMLIAPSKKKLHEIGCKEWSDVKYCPECGLKLEKK